ncbi:PIG-L deacetylase family protein [Dermatobacter hominis]|uniref:PIG-L deacetylase family protein n=1 Tax=Dermatobacter hominis TaxID=2884263 RepID=UPI001D12B541|nr:PIG-L family deacetylase [Dermatobacter hominis]UDY34507.1 PIG-L family deacetylase [Dermatobacter hominis]
MPLRRIGGDEEGTDMARDERLLVVVAHPDDETFGCGSLLAHARAVGVPTFVACATRGEAGSPTPGRGLDDADMAEVRAAELHAAAELLGVERVVLFDWADSDMEGEPAAGTLCAAPLDDVADRIAEVIDEIRPTVVVTLDASDGHRDHAHVRDATVMAASRPGSPVERVYLQCLAQTLMRRWVELLAADQPDSAHLELGDLGTPEDLITTYLDTAEHLELRDRAMGLHRSQTPPYDVMPADLRRDFLATDRLRRVIPPWTGGEPERRLFAG